MVDPKKYGLTNDDLKKIGVFDSTVLYVIWKGNTNKLSIESYVYTITKRLFDKLFSVEKVSIPDMIDESIIRLAKYGFIDPETMEPTEKGVSLINFLRDESELFYDLEKYKPKDIVDNIKQKLKPRVNIYDTKIIVRKYTPDGDEVIIFRSSTEQLEEYFNTHPEEFEKFVDFVFENVKKNLQELKVRSS